MAPTLRVSVSLPNIPLCQSSYITPPTNTKLPSNSVGTQTEDDEVVSLLSDISGTLVSEVVDSEYGDFESDFGDSFGDVEDGDSDSNDSLSHIFIEPLPRDPDHFTSMEPAMEREMLRLELELADQVS